MKQVFEIEIEVTKEKIDASDILHALKCAGDDYEMFSESNIKDIVVMLSV